MEQILLFPLRQSNNCVFVKLLTQPLVVEPSKFNIRDIKDLANIQLKPKLTAPYTREALGVWQC